MLPLDRNAARAARRLVREVDRGVTQQLRDDVVLVTSEVVARAMRQPQTEAGATVEVRVWMPGDIVRVEVRTGAAGLASDGPDPQGFSKTILDTLTDRWSLERRRDRDCLWFEIDR